MTRRKSVGRACNVTCKNYSEAELWPCLQRDHRRGRAVAVLARQFKDINWRGSCLTHVLDVQSRNSSNRIKHGHLCLLSSACTLARFVRQVSSLRAVLCIQLLPLVLLFVLTHGGVVSQERASKYLFCAAACFR